MPEGRARHERRAHRRAAGRPARHRCRRMTINRFCSSGLQAVALAADRIRLGDADVMIAGGTESMSMVPMMGNKVALNAGGLQATRTSPSPTAWASPPRRSPSNGRSRARSRMHSRVASHQKALAAIAAGEFDDEISALRRSSRSLAGPAHARASCTTRARSTTDEGPRAGHDAGGAGQAASRVRRAAAASPPATARRCPTAPAAVLLASEQAIKDYGLTPLARFVGFAVAGVPPEIMGIGPIEAIPKALSAGRHQRRTTSTGSSSTRRSPRRRSR